MSKAGPACVVILGGGFGGVGAAVELTRRARDRRSVEVHLVSDENYFVFHPLLVEVVSCRVEPSHVVSPIRHLCRHATVHCAHVQDFDPKRKCVTLVRGDGRKSDTLTYDHLILSLGLRADPRAIPGMAEHAFPLKTLGDAFHLRNHVLSRLEEAEREPDPKARRRLLSVVTVGGGVTGVEVVAEINDLLRSVLKFYPRARAVGHRTILVHSRDRILGELDASLAASARKKLEARGVELILGARVKEVTAEGVTLQDGRLIAADTVVSTIGNTPHPFVVQSDLPQERGRIVVDEFLRVRDSEDVWALGDTALVPNLHPQRTGPYCPPTAQYAARQGRHCARNVLAAFRNESSKPFVYGGVGQLVLVGHRSGVANLFGWRFSGMLAWALWRSVYLAKVPGLRNKVRVGLDWMLELLFPRDITKLDVERTDLLQRAHYRKGETIFREGDVGDRFFVIESGEVEILRQIPGQGASRVTTRSCGESFGEIALLENVPRTATVRCLSPVDVVAISRREFRTLVGTYTVLRVQLERDRGAAALRDEDRG